MWTFRLDSKESFQVINGTEEAWSSFTVGQTYQGCSWCIWSCFCIQGWMTGQRVVTAIPTFHWFQISNAAAKLLFPQSFVSIRSSLLDFSLLLYLCHPWISKNVSCPHFCASLLHILNLLILFSAAPWYWKHPLFFPIRHSYSFGVFFPILIIKRLLTWWDNLGLSFHLSSSDPSVLKSFLLSYTTQIKSVSWGPKCFSFTLSAGLRGNTTWHSADQSVWPSAPFLSNLGNQKH